MPASDCREELGLPQDSRRDIPRTDRLLADPALAGALLEFGRDAVKCAIHGAQERARAGELAPAEVREHVLAQLDLGPMTGTQSGQDRYPAGLQPVLNATGIVVHTNLGRAPLSSAARAALAAAAGYCDLEYDLADGARGPRGGPAREALVQAVPTAASALVVNNGAAALLLATAALAAGRRLLVSRGEVVEIGDGFRLLDLVATAGVEIVEVGTTNRTHLGDYADRCDVGTAAILKVHPSNFQVSGFTSAVGIAQLSGLGVPVIVDIGSGLLVPDPALPEEPDVTSALASGATVVTCSGDKLLGGPQAGLIIGADEVVTRCRRHPLARAVRADKLTLAALAATLRGPLPPVRRFLHADPAVLHRRCQAVAETVAMARPGLPVQVVPAEGAVGGGGAPGVSLPGWAIAVPAELAAPLRLGRPAVVARVARDRCLIDLRCIEPDDDARVALAVIAANG
ncbi:MAG: L-seryl-tRNA(Sec) selenium transferase [Austwickia sp.]|nr:L-seryl-tRNA(Sec) selenium transferase [Austwickia sp.]